MPKTEKARVHTHVKCGICGKILKENSRFYLIGFACVIRNDGKVWEYEREEDKGAYHLICGGKVLPRMV